MKLFPVTCIDDFYTDPIWVRDFALSCRFFPDDKGEWPGQRTEELHLIDQNFFKEFCKKIFSIYYDFDNTKINWIASTQFQLINSMDNDRNSPKNEGWIHLDNRTVFAGIIYLTPTIDPDSGTSIYSLKDPSRLDNSNAKFNFYKEKKDQDYDIKISRHNSSFEETIRFQNKFNRMILFDNTCYHKANNFYSETEPRLTQTFFVFEVDSDSQFPILRQKNFL